MVGGAEITAKEVRSGLISRGNEVVVITLSTNKTLPNDMLGHISLKLRNIYDPWRDKGKKNIIKKIFWKLIDFLEQKLIQYIKNKKLINEHDKSNKKKW